MVSVGMSLKLTVVVAHWKRVRWFTWIFLAMATFILPSTLALLVAKLFRLTPGETAGLFMVGVAPGAPLLTRNLARRGFDMPALVPASRYELHDTFQGGAVA